MIAGIQRECIFFRHPGANGNSIMKNDLVKSASQELIRLIVEGNNGTLWGRVAYDDNLIVEEASTLEELEFKMKSLLADIYNLHPDAYSFRIEYDLTAFFDRFDFLKVTKIAEEAGLNGSLVRQYASGKKFPSAKQAEKIEQAVKQLAQRLASVHIYVR